MKKCPINSFSNSSSYSYNIKSRDPVQTFTSKRFVCPHIRIHNHSSDSKSFWINVNFQVLQTEHQTSNKWLNLGVFQRERGSGTSIWSVIQQGQCSALRNMWGWRRRGGNDTGNLEQVRAGCSCAQSLPTLHIIISGPLPISVISTQ